jgi:hypothetical protein
MILGGVAFFIGGATHPGDSGEGSKVAQLHAMLVDPAWYPSHALLLTAFACFAAGIITIRMRGDLGAGMTKLLTVVSVITVIATLGMLLHLLAATNADAIAGHETNLRYHVQQVVETVFDSLWGLSIAALAVAGGLTRTVGNRITLALGLVGGLTFALASATIAFTDLFDPLFMLGSLIGVWGVAAGAMALLGRTESVTRRGSARATRGTWR